MQARAILVSLVSISMLCAGAAQARIISKPIKYTHEGANLEGVMVYDDSKPGPRPGVLVVHEWWGLNDYAKSRARQLAEMGYIAFAADMFGGGKQTKDPKQAEAWYNEAVSKPGLLAGRSKAALEVLRKEQGVDQNHIAAIGFCFGGSTVLKLAYSGEKLDGVVAFHPGVIPPDATEQKQIKTSIVVLYGEEDKFSKPEDIAAMRKAFEANKVDWYMVNYAQAVHAFTNPEADKFKIPGIGYNEKAAKRSWEEMQRFFDEKFGAKKKT